MLMNLLGPVLNDNFTELSLTEKDFQILCILVNLYFHQQLVYSSV